MTINNLVPYMVLGICAGFIGVKMDWPYFPHTFFLALALVVGFDVLKAVGALS